MPIEIEELIKMQKHYLGKTLPRTFSFEILGADH